MRRREREEVEKKQGWNCLVSQTALQCKHHQCRHLTALTVDFRWVRWQKCLVLNTIRLVYGRPEQTKQTLAKHRAEGVVLFFLCVYFPVDFSESWIILASICVMCFLLSTKQHTVGCHGDILYFCPCPTVVLRSGKKRKWKKSILSNACCYFKTDKINLHSPTSIYSSPNRIWAAGNLEIARLTCLPDKIRPNSLFAFLRFSVMHPANGPVPVRRWHSSCNRGERKGDGVQSGTTSKCWDCWVAFLYVQ